MAGRKAAVLQEQGFRFDMGPTILIQPSVCGDLLRSRPHHQRYLEMVRLDPQWRCFFDDGTVLDLKDDVREMAASLEGREPGWARRFSEFMALSEGCTASPTSSSSGSRTVRCAIPSTSAEASKSGSSKMSEHAPGTKRVRNHPRIHQRFARGPDARSLCQYVARRRITLPRFSVPSATCRRNKASGIRREAPCCSLALVRLGTELGVRYHTSIAIARLLTEGGAVCRPGTSDG